MNFLTKHSVKIFKVINPLLLLKNYTLNYYFSRFGNNLQQIAIGVLYSKIHKGNFYSPPHEHIKEFSVINNEIFDKFSLFKKRYRFFYFHDKKDFAGKKLKSEDVINNIQKTFKEHIRKNIKFLNNKEMNILTDNEVRNLNITKGTLLPEERDIINDHISITIDMLEELPYPKNLKNIPEFAGGHHEKMDGTGYPKGLKADQMSPQAKIMAIADIYEALTAADRPYKEGKKLSQAMRIMGFMKNDYHIDEDLFEIFVNSGVYKKYAENHVASNQIDQIDEKAVLGTK